MSLHCADPAKAVAFSRAVCQQRAAEIQKAAGTSDQARLVAKQILAELALEHSEPIGVALLNSEVRSELSVVDLDSDVLAVGTTIAPTTAEMTVPVHPTKTADPDETAGGEKAPKGLASSLKDCPYCDEPHRRFCSETGRRHETKGGRYRRLWRTLYRRVKCQRSPQNSVVPTGASDSASSVPPQDGSKEANFEL